MSLFCRWCVCSSRVLLLSIRCWCCCAASVCYLCFPALCLCVCVIILMFLIMCNLVSARSSYSYELCFIMCVCVCVFVSACSTSTSTNYASYCYVYCSSSFCLFFFVPSRRGLLWPVPMAYHFAPFHVGGSRSRVCFALCQGRGLKQIGCIFDSRAEVEPVARALSVILDPGMSWTA